MIYDDNSSDSIVEESQNASFYDLLLQQDTISELSGPGKQPLVGVLSKHFKLVFFDSHNVDAQRMHLVNFLYR